MDFTVFLNDINIDLLTKLGLSILVGIIIGLDRQLTNKLAGIKTQVLVCMGSTIFTYLSIHGFTNPEILNTPTVINPSRVAAQILTGVGFIGGGVILKTKNNVYGITTAASLWLVASVGMAVGCGYYFLAIVGTLLSVLFITLVRPLERKFLDKYSGKLNKIEIQLTIKKEHFDYISQYTKQFTTQVEELQFNSTAKKNDLINIEMILAVSSTKTSREIYSHFAKLQNIEDIKIKYIQDAFP